jgi:hypothetical protein
VFVSRAILVTLKRACLIVSSEAALRMITLGSLVSPLRVLRAGGVKT